MTKVAGQMVSFFGGVRYWATAPNKAGQQGVGFRLAFALLFPGKAFQGRGSHYSQLHSRRGKGEEIDWGDPAADVQGIWCK
jgi:hypothetical protein